MSPRLSRWEARRTMVDVIVEHREDLEALAERDDLRVSKYAKALLERTDTQA